MQNKTKILVYLAVWQRPEITELCFVGLERLKQHPDFDIEVLAVISEESMVPLCQKYNVNMVYHANEPLGMKKNFGLQAAAKFEFDYMMEIGSDDLVLNELLDSYKPMIAKKELFFGIRDAAYIDSESGHCRRLISSSTYGAGRMIHRSLLEQCSFRMWKDHLNRGLDNASVFMFQRMCIGYKQVAPIEFPCVIDVKSKVNIWHFRHDVGVPYDIDEVFKRLSGQEVEMINEMILVNASN